MKQSNFYLALSIQNCMSKVSAPVHRVLSTDQSLHKIYASAAKNICENKHIFSIIFLF